MMDQSVTSIARQELLEGVLRDLLWFDPTGIATNADRGSAKHPNKVSIEIGGRLARLLGANRTAAKLPAQTQGSRFEALIQKYLRDTFGRFGHLRPGNWTVGKLGSGGAKGISNFAQYGHLDYLETAASGNRQLAAALGRDYQIGPDAVIFRSPETDEFLEGDGPPIVDESTATYSPVRKRNNRVPILHACVSCKWTLRSDRAQNVRTEALNLIRNRKGPLPHIVAVTAEPLPSRIASLALGTGDVDCVYHLALPQLIQAVKEAGYDDAYEMLMTMVEGMRLRDVSDLPLDLVT